MGEEEEEMCKGLNAKFQGVCTVKEKFLAALMLL